jgi:hypothetical protein
MRKLLPALLSGAIVLIGALPAAALADVNAKLSGISNGQTVTGSVTVKGSASATTGVDKISISISGSIVKTQNFQGIQPNASTTHSWNTSFYTNGEYIVKVTAASKAGGTDSDSARALVDNAPAPVTGMSGSHNGGTVTLSWNPNSEADLIGYRVSRGGTSLGQTSETSITDQPGGGTHSYSVVAVRRSPTQPDGKTGGADSTSVTVPEAAAGNGSGSGSGGGSGGGSNGSSVPGYGQTSGKKGSSGSSGSGGPSGAPGYGGGFTVGGKSLSGIGLPNNLTLPGPRLTPGSGSIAAPNDETFSEELPYDLQNGRDGQLQTERPGGNNVAALSDSTLIPPDGLRWVAAGLWLLVTAALLKFLERRVAAREAAASAAPELLLVEDEPPSKARFAH